MENTDNSSKQRWLIYLMPLLAIAFGNLLMRLWNLPFIVNNLLVLILFSLAAYWLIPRPRKIGFTKYAREILLVILGLSLFLFGIPSLLRHYISMGWAFGL